MLSNASFPDSNEESIKWVRHDVKVKGDSEKNRPTPRSGHTLTVIGTNAYLFGGLALNSDSPLLDDNIKVHTKGNNEDIGDDENEIDDALDALVTADAVYDMYLLKLVGAGGMEWTKLTFDTKNVDVPLGRWRHTANVFDNNNIVVFGGYHTQEHRLNDVWVFDTFTYGWKQPNPEHNNDASVPYQLTNNSWTNVPPPRAAHTATMIGENLYIFGGNGGLS